MSVLLEGVIKQYHCDPSHLAQICYEDLVAITVLTTIFQFWLWRNVKNQTDDSVPLIFLSLISCLEWLVWIWYWSMKTETSAEKWFVTSSRCFMGFILALSWRSDGSLLAMMLSSRVDHVGALWCPYLALLTTGWCSLANCTSGATLTSFEKLLTAVMSGAFLVRCKPVSVSSLL